MQIDKTVEITYTYTMSKKEVDAIYDMLLEAYVGQDDKEREAKREGSESCAQYHEKRKSKILEMVDQFNTYKMAIEE